MSAHVEWHDPTVADVRITPPETTWDGIAATDGDFDPDQATDAGHYALTIDCIENVAVFEGTPVELGRLVDRITSTWVAFTVGLATAEHLYRKCRHCHLFVDDNPAHGDAPGLARWIHLHRGEGEDVLLDESHEPEPEVEGHPLDWWKQHGPYAMRVRFTDYTPPTSEEPS